jgi:hypothetical protein
MAMGHTLRCLAIGASSWFISGLTLHPLLAQSLPPAVTILAEPCVGDYPRCPRPELWRLGSFRARPAQGLQRCPQGFAQLAPGSVLGSTIVCREGLTLPSLWWTQEQFGSQGRGYPEYPKLVQDWLTYVPEQNQVSRVDLFLELQRWSMMDYFKRYEFLSVFGSAAESFGYNLRAFSFRGEFLGAYTCLEADGGARQCQIEVEGSGAQAKPSNFLAQ